MTSLVAQMVALLFAIDVAVEADGVPRHTTVLGVGIGGLDEDDAAQRFRERLGARAGSPVTVVAADRERTFDPGSVGLQIDWQRTVERAAEQPLNPFRRLTTLVTDRDVEPVVRMDEARARAILTELQGEVRMVPQDGGITFDGARAVLVEPRPGRDLDLDAALTNIRERWLRDDVIRLPVDEEPPRVNADAARRAFTDLARPAVSAPLVVEGDGARATLTPVQIAAALSVVPDPSGRLVLGVDRRRLTEMLRPQLASTELPAVDARVVIRDGRPEVEPSRDGRGIDYEQTLADVENVLQQTDDRSLTAVYTDQRPRRTTQQARQLGIVEIVGEFTTGGFASDSGQNIRRIAEVVNGALVGPGETFSLNGYTAPRDEAAGYVPAGIIEDGVPDRAVGGGVSQFATTLYNATYFAGMIDVEHREHSYYISRYPVAREATVFEGAIDLKFRNPGPSAVLIETSWTPSSITVRLWGTKRFEVTSQTSGRFDLRPAGTEAGPPGRCMPSPPVSGFSATDVRRIRDLTTGEVREETRTVTYSPKPRIICPD